MGLQAVPSYIGQSGFVTPTENERRLVKEAFGRRAGVRGIGDFAVTPGTGFQYNVAGGTMILDGRDQPATQNSYLAWSSGTDTRTWPSPGSQPRIDTLILRVVDPQYQSGFTPDCRYEVIQGTPSGSPVAPDDTAINGGGSYRPGAWDRIWDFRVNPTDTSLVTGFDRRRMGQSASGVLLARTFSELPTTGVEEGQTGYAIDTKIRYWWNGTTWWRIIDENTHGLGLIAWDNLAAPASSVTGATPVDTGLSVTFNAKAGRKYRISYRVRALTASNPTSAMIPATWMTADCLAAVGGSPFNTNVDMKSGYQPFIGGNGVAVVRAENLWYPTSDETVTLQVKANGPTGNTVAMVVASSFNMCYLRVYDEGISQGT